MSAHRRCSPRGSPAKRGRGFAVVSAVFLLTVLAVLAGVIVSLATAQHAAHVRDWSGSQAYFAARAGLEWGLYGVLQAGGSCTGSRTLTARPAGFSVTVDCAAAGTADEAGTTTTVYRITATASRGTAGSLDYAERQLQALVSRP